MSKNYKKTFKNYGNMQILKTEVQNVKKVEVFTIWVENHRLGKKIDQNSLKIQKPDQTRGKIVKKYMKTRLKNAQKNP